MKCKCVAIKSRKRKIFDLNVNFEWNWHLSVVTHWQKYQKVIMHKRKKDGCTPVDSYGLWHIRHRINLVMFECLVFLHFGALCNTKIRFHHLHVLRWRNAPNVRNTREQYNERRIDEIEGKTDTRWVRNWNEITK